MLGDPRFLPVAGISRAVNRQSLIFFDKSGIVAGIVLGEKGGDNSIQILMLLAVQFFPSALHNRRKTCKRLCGVFSHGIRITHSDFPI